MWLVFILSFLLLLSCALGTMYDRLVNLNQDHFDFVIIGGKRRNINSHWVECISSFRRNCWRSACESTVRDRILPGLGRGGRSKVCWVN